MTMDFRSARAKAKAMLAPTRPRDLSPSALTEDKLRDNIMSEVEANSERYRKAINKTPEVTYEVANEDGSTEERTYKWDGFGETVRDFGRALFGIDHPEIRPADEVRPENQLGRDVIQFGVAQEGFMEAWPYAKMNEAEAQYGAMAAADSLLESAGTILAEHVKQSEEIREASGDMQTAQEMWDELMNQAKVDVAETGTVRPGTRSGIKQGIKAIDAAQANLGGLIGQMQVSGQVLAAAQAAQNAATAAAEAVEAVSNLPGIEAGAAHNISPDRQIELAEKWAQNPELKKIARMMGRMYRDVRFKRETRTKNVPIEPVGITTGNDLDRLLPHELARAFMGGTS